MVSKNFDIKVSEPARLRGAGLFRSLANTRLSASEAIHMVCRANR